MGKSAKNKLRGGKPPTATPVVAVTKAADQAAAIPPPPPPPPPATLAAQTQKITLAEDMTPDQRRQKEHQDNLNALRTLAEGAVQYWRPRMRGRFSRGRSKTKKRGTEGTICIGGAADAGKIVTPGCGCSGEGSLRAASRPAGVGLPSNPFIYTSHPSRPGPSLHLLSPTCSCQWSIWPTVRGKGITSRMLPIAVA